MLYYRDKILVLIRTRAGRIKFKSTEVEKIQKKTMCFMKSKVKLAKSIS